MYAKIIEYSLLSFLLLSSFSCSNTREHQQEELKQIHVVLPLDKLERIPTYLDNKIDDKKEAELRFVIYADTASCTPCTIAHLNEWNSIMYKANQITEVDFYYIFQKSVHDKESFKRYIQELRFTNEIYIDCNNEMIKNNPFLNGTRFHYLLINNHGNILYIGNPVNNEQAENKLYDVLLQAKSGTGISN